EKPGRKCRSGKPRTDRKMGQIARGAQTAWDGGDRAFSLGSARIQWRSRQGDFDRHVIRRLFLGPPFLIDLNLDQPVGCLRREQVMVDADALAALPGARLIIPECVERGSVRGGPQGVGQTQIEETAKARPGLWKEKRVAFPGGRIGGVVWCWNHIVVAGENQRLLQRQKSFCVGDEPVHEGELVTVFL